MKLTNKGAILLKRYKELDDVVKTQNGTEFFIDSSWGTKYDYAKLLFKIVYAYDTSLQGLDVYVAHTALNHEVMLGENNEIFYLSNEEEILAIQGKNGCRLPHARFIEVEPEEIEVKALAYSKTEQVATLCKSKNFVPNVCKIGDKIGYWGMLYKHELADSTVCYFLDIRKAYFNFTSDMLITDKFCLVDVKEQPSDEITTKSGLIVKRKQANFAVDRSVVVYAPANFTYGSGTEIYNRKSSGLKVNFKGETRYLITEEEIYGEVIK
jgi:hypothetical protein